MEHFTRKIGTREAVLHAYLIGLDKLQDNSPKRPAVLIFPGGSYEFCSPWEDEPVALAYMAEGYQAFSLYYSVSKDPKEQVFPHVFEEAEEALRTIREHAEEWNVDPNRIAVIGFSAGGHLAAYLSAAGKEKPNASILGYPRIFGSKPGEERFVPDAAEAVDRNTPPAFIFGTREDEAVGPPHGMAYASALQKHHILYEIHYFEHGGHGMVLGKSWSANGFGPACNPAFSRWFPMSIDWLRLRFGDFPLREPENRIASRSPAMDMPLEFLLEDEAKKQILFETVPAFAGVLQLNHDAVNDFTINRIALVLKQLFPKEVMETLDARFLALDGSN